jgi:hypothetical protein
MKRKPIPRALICSALVAALGCSPAPSGHLPHQSSFHPITSGVTLYTVITSDKGGMPALRISLRNVAETSISVETGRPFYPAANFTFQIALQDGRRFELLCDLCGNGGIVPGRPANYWVELRPQKTWSFDLPLRGFLYVDSGDQRLDKLAARQATIATTLRGTKPRESLDPADGKTVWEGTASVDITLPAFSRRVQRRLASGGDYARHSSVPMR